jgi:trk system potassium uptake protein TrkH
MSGPLFLITLSAAGLFGLYVPAILVAIANSESQLAIDMTLLASIGAFLTLAILTAITGKPRKTDRAFSFLALVGVWVATPLFGAVSFVVLADLAFMPAWFEAVGALTTSGASVLVRETAPRGLLFWRALLEWYGGFLTLASIVHVLAPAGFGGLQGISSRLLAGSHDDSLYRPEAYRMLLLQYSLITCVIFFGLMIFGVNPLEAVMLGMISAATGGFVPFVDPLEEHIGAAATMVMAVGLCAGTMSVFWRRQILRRPTRIFQNNMEAKILFAVIAALTVMYAARIVDVSGGSISENLLPALREGFFTASSLVATSGIETRPGVIALLPNIVVLAVIFVGAGVYSTSGGVKIFRIGAMWVYTLAELNRLIYPNSVDRLKFGETPINRDAMQAIWTYFIIAILVIGLGASLIALTATGFEAAIVLAVALFSNASPVYNALQPVSVDAVTQWPTFQNLPNHLTYLLSIAIMTVGRLEVLVVFAVLNIKYWYNR